MSRSGCRGAATLLAAIAALVALSACNSEATGTPTPAGLTPASTGASESATPPPRPPRSVANISTCDDLSPATIAALGLPPETKEDASLRGQVTERGCGWTGADALVDISTTTGTVAMYRERPRQANVQLRTVAGLPSISFQIPNDPEGCSLISDIPGGGLVVQFRIKGEHEAAVGTDSCTAAVRVMERVAPILLQQK